MHYLDNAATTKVADAVLKQVCTVLESHFANASSLYLPGVNSEAVLEDAREFVAHSLGAKSGEIIFTASGTEGNNIAILGACAARKSWANHIVVTGYEHPSVQNTVTALAKDGWQVTTIMPDKTGNIDSGRLLDAVTQKTALVAAMHVNNEIGAVLDVAALAKKVKQKNNRTAVHVDGVQAWGKLPLRLCNTEIDTYAVSGHKIHAPKGVGALYIRNKFYIVPVYYGGHQEKNLRPGTENVAYISGMATAIAQMQPGKNEKIKALSQQLWDGVSQIEGIVRNSPQDAFCGVANFSVENIKSETMLHFLESKEIYVSSGSACSKGELSHTLTAMGLPKERVETAIRISFSQENEPEDVAVLLQALKDGIATLAKIRR